MARGAVSKRDSRALRPNARERRQSQRCRLCWMMGSCPNTEAACSSLIQLAHSSPPSMRGVQSRSSQRMRKAWSEADDIEMLSIGSKPMAQIAGCEPSSCSSHEEPELDSKTTTNGTTPKAALPLRPADFPPSLAPRINRTA
eukprot:scaffold8995_cov120-Isochrysis_galbana.AAC.4